MIGDKVAVVFKKEYGKAALKEWVMRSKNKASARAGIAFCEGGGDFSDLFVAAQTALILARVKKCAVHVLNNWQTNLEAVG